MKKKDFREMMQKVIQVFCYLFFQSITIQALPSSEAAKMEKHMFRIYDVNDDGYIDFVEFMVRISFLM